MNAALGGLALLLILATLYGGWRQARQRGWRWWLLAVLLQASAAAVLWQLLHPPAQLPSPTTLLLLTGGHGLDDERALQGLAERRFEPPLPQSLVSASWTLVALPEAGALPAALAGRVERHADLASALRRHAASRLLLLGDGLPPRDWQAAHGVPLHLATAADGGPEGIVELQPLPPQRPGAWWTLQGWLALADSTGWQLRLLDPGGGASVTLPVAAEQFRLSARTAVAGRHLYRLQLLDASGTVRQDLPVPLQVQAPAPLRLALLAAAPSPESKFLRRWASDAGLQQSARIQLRPGMALGSLPQDWSEVDLLIVEDRAWLALPAAQRAAVQAAVNDGLGLLLRLTAPPDERSRGALAELGFSLQPTEQSRSVQLPPPAGLPVCLPTAASAAADAAADAAAATADAAPRGCQRQGDVELSRLPLRDDGIQTQPLLKAADGAALGSWRNAGAGRIGVLWLLDSHRLALAAEPALHADHWSRWSGVLARANAEAAQPAPLQAWLGQRSVLCADWGSVQHEDDAADQAYRLLPDPLAQGCRGWWPRSPGWHRLQAAADAADDAGTESPTAWVYVLDPAAAPQLWRQQLQHWAQAHRAPSEATTDAAATPSGTSEPLPRPGPRWPWWLALWVVLTLLWWWERPSGTTAADP